VYDKELVSILLDGLPPSWKNFVQGVCACENLLDFVKLLGYPCGGREQVEVLFRETK